MKPNPLIPSPSTPPDVPRWTETLRDRSEVLIRPLLPTDRAAETRFIEGLSKQSRQYRFLGQVNPSGALIDRLMDVDFAHDVAFVAVMAEDAHECIIGVARYSVDADATRCECAVTVADAWHEKGLGTALMRHLIDVARARGIRTMYSIDAVENVDMRELARHLGFETRRDPEDSTLYIHTLDLQTTATPALK